MSTRTFIPLTLLTSLLNYHKETKTFTTELSMLRHVFGTPATELSIPVRLQVQGDRNGVTRTFRYTRADRDASGEDVYGWNFETDDGGTPLRLLIVND